MDHYNQVVMKLGQRLDRPAARQTKTAHLIRPLVGGFLLDQ
jgi:hypothetical protein